MAWRRSGLVLGYVAIALAAGALGAAACAVGGIYVYRLFSAPHGCGDIGCWDFLIGAFWGAALGFVGGSFAGWRLLRARRLAALAALRVRQS